MMRKPEKHLGDYEESPAIEIFREWVAALKAFKKEADRLIEKAGGPEHMKISRLQRGTEWWEIRVEMKNVKKP